MKNTLLYAMYIALMCSCASTNNALKIRDLPNYQKNTPLIVFMDFKITKVGNDDQVTMTNAIAGQGELRPVTHAPSTPTQVKAVLKGSNDETLQEWLLDYPVNRSVEIMDEKGGIERKDLNNQEGTVTLKFQQNAQQKALELYRLDPDKKSTKIYSIQLKP